MVLDFFPGLFSSSNNKKTPVEKEVIANPYTPVATQINPASNKAIVGGVTVNRSTVKNMNVMRQKPIIETNRKNINALNKIRIEARQEAIRAEANAKIKVKKFANAQKHAEIAKAEFMKRKANMNSKEVALKEAQNYAIKMKGEAARREMERAVKNIRNVELVKENIKKQPINLTRFNHAINVVNLKGGKMKRNMEVQTEPSSRINSSSNSRDSGAFKILTNRMSSRIERLQKQLQTNNTALNRILNSYRTPSKVKVVRKPTGILNYNNEQNKIKISNLAVDVKRLEKLLKDDSNENPIIKKLKQRNRNLLIEEQKKLKKIVSNRLKNNARQKEKENNAASSGGNARGGEGQRQNNAA